MARNNLMPLESVLRQLDDEDRSTDFMVEGSDDDLGMDSDSDYDYDSTVEGIFNRIMLLFSIVILVQ